MFVLVGCGERYRFVRGVGNVCVRACGFAWLRISVFVCVGVSFVCAILYKANPQCNNLSVPFARALLFVYT